MGSISSLPAPPPDVDTVTAAGQSLSFGAPARPAVTHAPPACIGGRYSVQKELGRGGTAIVHQVFDSVAGQPLALKRLKRTGDERHDLELIAAFEREYHCLVELSHPRIVQVHDFGSEGGVPYYTMELLDGGDLRQRAPIAWTEACALAYDVCSSLALLHSRRLVHRDVSPRNVRITAEGFAKVIDFGGMAPMGVAGNIIGTPPFLPPEVLHRSTLDARTDLFSLGATLYYALTGEPPFPAKSLSQLQQLWAERPPPPSARAGTVPAGLDSLVMSLISLDPATRPRSAFEVMQRLSALADLDREAPDVSRAYLSTPTMVGRDALIEDLNARIRRALDRQGNAVLIEGPAGVGRTRMLDACALDAKIAGASVLRVNAANTRDAVFGLGLSLVSQLAVALPEPSRACAREMQLDTILFGADGEGSVAGESSGLRGPALKTLLGDGALASLQPRVTEWLLRIANVHPLAILVDDLHEIDRASLSLLAALALRAKRRHLFVLSTCVAGARSEAVDVLDVYRRACSVVELMPLGRTDVELLVGSLFGDVPHLARLSEFLYRAAEGNPSETLEGVQALIGRGVVRYEGGEWLLPARLSLDELPSSALDRCASRIRELSPLARKLAEVHALASHPNLSRQQQALAAGGVPTAQLDAAISELVSAHLLVGDGRSYMLARREWAAALDSELDDATRAAHHEVLAMLYAGDAARVIERVFHLLRARRDVQALDLLLPALTNATTSYGILALTSMTPECVAQLLERALTRAENLGRPPRELYELRRGVLAISVVADEAYYFRAAPELLRQLEQDSGLALYRASADSEPGFARVMQALAQVQARYDATAADARVLTPQEAIKGLAYYVAISIAVGSRTANVGLLRSLPDLLEPFAGLSPIIHAMWQNAIATRETNSDNLPERARERWLEVDAALAKVPEAEMNYVAQLRGAITYGIALIEAQLGLPCAEQTAGKLDNDPMQRASAMSLRRIARLHQGDRAAAERFRKQAELIALNSGQRSMFSKTLVAELLAHAAIGDLAGIREASQGIVALAERFAGWVAYQHLAEGYFEQARGQFDAARTAFERGLALAVPDPADPNRSTSAWLPLEAAYVETLTSLGHLELARGRALEALERCSARGISVAASPVRRALALAEARLGDLPGAAARLEVLIEELRALGTEGLELGASYEARATVAIWAADTAATEHYGRLTAKEYRYGQDSPLGARYERLMDQARKTGGAGLPELYEMRSSSLTSRLHTNATLVSDTGEHTDVESVQDREGASG